jgi:hypothetical protein
MSRALPDARHWKAAFLVLVAPAFFDLAAYSDEADAA